MLLAVCKATGKEWDCVPKIAYGLQGGFMAGEVCGAASGAVLALGLLYGDRDNELVQHLTEQFMHRFAERNGAVRCIDIIGFNIGDANRGDFKISSVKDFLSFLARGGKRGCKRVVHNAVASLVEELNEWES